MQHDVINLAGGVNQPGSDNRFQAFTKARDNFARLFGGVEQVHVAASATQPITTAHHGATVFLNGAGATISWTASNLFDGFVLKVVNDTGSDWTIPNGGATLRPDDAGHTKIASGGSAGFELFTRSGLRWHISGTTVA